MSGPVVTVAVLAYGEEPLLEQSLRSVLASEGVTVDLRLVDNGCRNPELESLARLDGVTLLRPEGNTGFAGGCNLALATATGAAVALVNSDAVVAPDALRLLVDAVQDPTVGIATACVVLADAPDVVNSAGNPFSCTGMSWAGGLGDPVESHAVPLDVAGASGACCVLRRETWERLGGFDPTYFCYHEDADLSLRCWQAGLRVRYVPAAVATHDFHFSRNPFKEHLLERNRWLMLLTDLQLRTLLVLSPALLVVEVAVLGLSIQQGWWRGKLSAWRWLLAHRHHVVERRAWVQSRRRVPDRESSRLWTGQISASGHDLPPGMGLLNAALDAYWRVARHLL